MPSTNNEWIEAFLIFNKYIGEEYEGGGIYRSTVYEVFGGPSPEQVTPEDMKRLDELGWHPYEDISFYAFI